MKHFSLVLNIILVVAVAVLFYLHFSPAKNTVAKNAGNSNVPAAVNNSGSKGIMIAYIEIDSIYDNVAHIRQEQKSLEAEGESIAKQYENGAIKFEKDKNEFLQNAQGMTPQQREDGQTRLMQAQQNIEANRQTQMQNLAAKRSRTMEDIQGRLKKFLDEYNSDRRYSFIFATGAGLDYMMYKDSAHNITPDVIEGLNKAFEKKDK